MQTALGELHSLVMSKDAAGILRGEQELPCGAGKIATDFIEACQLGGQRGGACAVVKFEAVCEKASESPAAG